MTIHKFTGAINALFLLASSLPLAVEGQPVPVDSTFRIGKLPNGMTYYIRHNEEPKDRASFYIIQNVGALLEEDSQNGLAHFLEHMAFNGTRNFPGKGIINTLEKHGVAFGRNINAYTSFSETVYNLSDVPVRDPGLVDTCLLVLHDWAHYLLLSDKEIDDERGVITEEWRTRRTAQFRMQREMFPVLFKGSNYATRDVIGDSAIIRHFKYDTLRKFYRDWYRTDLQCIAIVGDINVDEVEKVIQAKFSQIPAVENPVPRGEDSVPFHRETLYVSLKDKEATQYSVSIYIKHPEPKPDTKDLAYYRDQYVNELFNSMMRDRISELLQKGVAPFVSGSVGFYGLVSGINVLAVSATAHPDQEEQALRSIYGEAQRVVRFGFTAGELDRAKRNMLTQIETLWKERDKIQNDEYISDIQSHYLSNEPLTSIDYDWKMVQQIMPSISVEEMLAKAKQLIVPENRVIIVSGPDTGTANLLSEADAHAILREVEQADIKPYEDMLVSTALIDYPLKGSPVIKTTALPQFKAVEWTLANNAKVVYRFADYEKDNILINCISPGGTSLIPNAMLPSAMMLSQFIGRFGVGDFDATTLKKMLTGKNVSLSIGLTDLNETVTGTAAPKDFETLMQLLYLQFERPRFDNESFTALKGRFAGLAANMANDPQKAISDSLQLILSDYNERTRLITPDFIEELSLSQMEKIFRDRISDAGDFTFFIVGNLEESIVKSLAEKYIGSLTDLPRTETWKDNNIHFPAGKTVREIRIPMEVNKASVVVTYTKSASYDSRSNLILNVLKGILSLRYLDEVREKEGGTYTVSVLASNDHYPKAEKTVQILFDAEPERSAQLKSIVYREINAILTNGPKADELDKVVKNMLKEREQGKQHNGYWMGRIIEYYVHSVNNDDPENFEKILTSLTVEEIQEFAAGFLKDADLVDVVFLPAVR